MAVLWKINGTEAGPGHKLRDLRLSFENQIPDEFTFVQDGAAFDGTALFAIGDEVALTRTEGATTVTWFRGKIVEIPRAGASAGESLSYRALGGWYELQQFAFLQNYKTPVDDADPASSLTSVLIGRVILSQDDTGAKVSIGSSISEVIAFAIASGADVQAGTISVAQTIPWDELTDLSCADAIQRLLQFAPDVVCWFDYTVDPPAFNCQRRASLSAATLTLGTDPIESVDIRPRPDLQVSNVCLLYRRTNRANEAAWVTVEKDVAPGGTTGRERGALVRTIELAGSVYNSTILEQKITTTEFSPSLLGFGDGPLTSGSSFDSLKFFWRRHHPALQSANVTIKSFRAGTFGVADPDETLDTTCIRELVTGAITDWMEDFQGVVTQQVAAGAEIEIEITDPSTSKKERVVIKASAVMTATNASKTLYTFLADDSFTEAEASPSGLASSLYSALNFTPWEGRITLVEAEASAQPNIGKKLNIASAASDWASMAALIQRQSVNVDAGTTEITIGPAKALGADDLVALYRSNRNRQPVTSHLIRTTGKTGGTQQRASLSKHHPVKPGSPPIGAAGRVYTTDVA